jgi:hypothetical protein
VNSPEPDLGLIGIWAGDLDNYPMADVRTAAAAIEDFGYGARHDLASSPAPVHG